MLKKVLIGIGVVVVLVVLVGFLLPSEVHVDRSVVINAPAEKVFNQLNNFKDAQAWSPWQKMDPEMKHDFTGPDAGVGHKDSWDSKEKNVGVGSQEIIESVPNSKIVSKLTFAGEEGGTATFNLEPEGEGTKVTWAMDMNMGGNPFAHYMGLMMNKWMGPVFEQGLNDMKAHVESLPEPEMEVMPEEGAQTDSLNAVTPEVGG